MSEERYIPVEEAAKELGISGTWVRHMCLDGRVVGAMKVGPVWMIPTPVRIKSNVDDGYLNTTEAAKMMGITRRRLMQLCWQGRIVGAKKKGNIWMIPLPIQRLRMKRGRKPKRTESSSDEASQ